ncbi:hypothetical protein FPFC_031910 [Fructobacillus pseudoficulneus]|uniref:Uncharacterized protein n=1 Tax=Fructobacillus pseudoficulneus TaxID=220714 RepID=A0A3F3GUH0_9LACO|nr:hypothetical protein [Fructobacillus pseudoficulneus]GAP03005.1 hypothetical protein FPFC_031910 [Fructobacillus pseudoficulneus]SEH44558.1 hypothetical protein SAMN05660469_1163 [Fructobacillus pseudoficulneus]
MQVNLESRPNYNQIFKQGKQVLARLRRHFAVVPLEHQQSSTELINRLELAINMGQPVKVQMNFGFDQENIQDFYGVLSQTPAGILLIQDQKSKQLHQLMPDLLRHISFS